MSELKELPQEEFASNWELNRKWNLRNSSAVREENREVHERILEKEKLRADFEES